MAKYPILDTDRRRWWGSVNVARALELADSQAAFTYGWDDFRPIGLVIFTDGGSEAIFVADPKASVRDVAVATGRAARPQFRRVAALGVMCAAWASRQAGTDVIDPKDAPDRQRARITYAADVAGLAHTFTNISGERHHSAMPLRDCEPIPAVLAQVLAEATHSAWDFCGSGTHLRTPLL